MTLKGSDMTVGSCRQHAKVFPDYTSALFPFPADCPLAALPRNWPTVALAAAIAVAVALAMVVGG
jgi:hypothetical protein